MGTTIEELEGMFDDHPSLNASLQDFEQGSIEIDHNPLVILATPPNIRVSQRHGLGGRTERLGIPGWLQSTSMETRGKRQPKQRLLESA
ncbi:hypothetical protein EYC84_003326 [Monilinia fructicola]|uniref:Uncharacterized protein n=1 Tax=Monilinia fructicola TaxID=38448 RepID=A0A5M9JU56_MONFR|nr:hypothetical protein EYC84_003326 [Monilinia fructicola]